MTTVFVAWKDEYKEETVIYGVFATAASARAAVDAECDKPQVWSEPVPSKMWRGTSGSPFGDPYVFQVGTFEVQS